MVLEADVTPQTKNPELVSSQAQSLTKKYQETKELLKLQELKKRNMQAQLGLSLSHLPIKEPYFSEHQKQTLLEIPPLEPVQKTLSFLLLDSAEAIQELEDLITGKPLSLMDLGKILKSHSCYQDMSEKYQLEKLLETWKYQQEVENETIKMSLARAGESIREYEARLLTMEDLVGKVQKQTSLYGPLSKTENHSETNEMTIGILSQRLELLTNENGALKQRCQEIVNQLTEADREIDRLKAELIAQQGGQQHHVTMEELKRAKAELAENQANAIDREYYERELNEKSLRLHEALVTLEELGSSLRDTEKKLQLKEATLKGLGFHTDYEDEEVNPEKEQLKELLEASQTRFFEMEQMLESAEQHCVELEARNVELSKFKQESEKASSEKLAEAENEIRMLRDKLQMNTGVFENTASECVEVGDQQVDEKGIVTQVVEDIVMKSKAIDQVVEMLAGVDVNVGRMLGNLKSTLFESWEEKSPCVSQKDMRLIVEVEFWSRVLGSVETPPEENAHRCWSKVAAQMMVQKRLMLLINAVCPQARVESDMTETNLESMYSWLSDDTNSLIIQKLRETLEEKSNALKWLASSVTQDKDDTLLSLALTSFQFGREQKQWSEYLLEALKEACVSYLFIRLKTQHEKELTQKQAEIQIGSSECPNCPKLKEEVIDLQSKLADLQSLSEASLKTATAPQTLIHFEGDPSDSLDKTIELQDMTALHRKELREIRDGYEQETEKLRQEVAKVSETLRLRSEENVKEIDSLTNCMENLKRKHEMERTNLIEKFDREMEELRSMMSTANPDKTSSDQDGTSHNTLAQPSTLKERIQELLTQVSDMTKEMRRREEQGDITTLRLKYEKDLENLKVEALLVLAVLHL